MLKAVIIDDSVQAREYLRNELKSNCPDVEILAEAENVTTGLQLLSKVKTDIVFSDVEMPDGTGFEMIEKLRQIKPVFDFQLIFTTAYDQYAVKAIKFSAIDYLLKPVVSDELVLAVEKVRSKISSSVSQASIDTLINNMRTTGKAPKTIVLSTSENILVYKTDEIVRCESERNYTKFYFLNDKPLLVSKTLKEYEELLGDHGFERIHNSHLVNVAQIKKFVKSDGGYVIMKDGSNVPVSQRKRDQIMDILSSIS